jgi:hypothetical protein
MALGNSIPGCCKLSDTSHRIKELVDRVRRDVRTRVEGPDPEVLRELVEYGTPALRSLVNSGLLVADRGPLPWQTQIENQWMVFGAFARQRPDLLLNDETLDPREFVVELSTAHPPIAAPHFIAWLRDESEWVRNHATEGLLSLKWPAAIPDLLRILELHPESDESSRIVHAIHDWSALFAVCKADHLRAVAVAQRERGYHGTARVASELATHLKSREG